MVDRGVSALLEDLSERGMSEDVVVCMLGEFGRTPRINGQAGRDHWGLCQSVLLAGGGVRGGQVVGASDRIAAYPVSDPVDPVDVHATLYAAMGIDPGGHLRDGLDRPWQLCTGRVVPRLL
jgi:uncharacterized protein (DUF1501 family)